MNSTVSLIIPVYNAEKTIERCIHSILRQTYSLIEVIVINDGSTDKSDSIISKICEDNKEIIYIKQNNSGVSVARNHGMSVSTGKYIMFVDADDWIEKDCVDKMVTALQATNSDYCFSDWYVEKTNKTYVDCVNKNFDSVFSADILYRFYISNRYGCAPWGKLYKRKLITDNKISFKEGLPYAEDYLFVLEYLSVADMCTYINEPLIHYDCIQLGAVTKIRSNYFELQDQIENYKEQIIITSPKYKTSDDELLKISKLKSYVSALVYLQLLYTNFCDCYNMANTIIKKLNENHNMALIKKANLKRVEKVYAFLAFTKNAFGVSVLTMLIRNIKRLVRT